MNYAMTFAEELDIEKRDAISPNEWGKDHWSVFLYIETVCVDYKGIPDLRRVQCNIDRHPGLITCSPITGIPMDGKEWPIRLKNREIVDYDEWDCLEDAESAGFIQHIGTGIHPRYKMTEKGSMVASLLRAHKANGKPIRLFEWHEDT